MMWLKCLIHRRVPDVSLRECVSASVDLALLSRNAKLRDDEKRREVTSVQIQLDAAHFSGLKVLKWTVSAGTFSVALSTTRLGTCCM